MATVIAEPPAYAPASSSQDLLDLRPSSLTPPPAYTERAARKLRITSPPGEGILHASILDAAGRPLYTTSSDAKLKKTSVRRVGPYLDSDAETDVAIEEPHGEELARFKWDRASPRVRFCPGDDKKKRRKVKCKEWLPLAGSSAKSDLQYVFFSNCIDLLPRELLKLEVLMALHWLQISHSHTRRRPVFPHRAQRRHWLCTCYTLPILVHIKHSLTRSPFSSSALTTRLRPRSLPSHGGVRHQTPNRSVWTSLMTSARFRDCSMLSCLRSSCCRVGSHSAIYQIVSTRLRPSFLVLLSSCGDDNKSHIYTICLVLDFFSPDAQK